MQNIIDFVGFFFGADFRQWLMEEANLLHLRARRFIYWLIALAFLGIGLNLTHWNEYGFRAVNVYIGIVLNIAAVLVITRPSILLTIFGIGAVGSQFTGQVGFRSGITNGKDLLVKAAEGVSVFFIFFSFFFLAAGTMNFRVNLGAIAPIILCLLIFFWMGQAKWFKISFQRKFIYVYTFVVIVWSMFSLIPRPVYIKTIGFYPQALFQTSLVEDGVSRVEEAIQEKYQERAKEILSAIEEKVKNGEKLTAKEQAFFERTRQERDNGKLLNQISNALTPSEGSGATIKVVATDIPKGTYEHTLEATHELDYIRPTGPYDISSPDMEFDIITKSGRVVSSLDKANWPAIGEPFRIVALKKQHLTIKVG